jgi:hypothetical protein
MRRAEYLAQLAAKFPERSRHGYVIGHYVYAGYGVAQQREAGPFPTAEEATERAETVLDGQVICGVVSTDDGKVIRDERARS